MFPRLRGQETFVAETFFASEKQKMFLTFFRNILFLQQMFPRLRGQGTMFPQQCFRDNVSSFAGALRKQLVTLKYSTNKLLEGGRITELLKPTGMIIARVCIAGP